MRQMFRILKIIFGISFLLFAFCLGVFFYVLHSHSIDFSALARYNPDKASIVLDDEGNEWARFQLDRREPIKLQKIPPQLINAFVAAEDRNFFNHSGISWRGILRSIVVNVYHGRKVQGASTITQQLVKLLFFSSSKTFERKIKEQIYAILIERQFTKELILETYLNHVYFGCGIYGVQAACQRFWGIDVTQISVSQSATLASIIRSPGNYCPILYPDAAERLRNTVLTAMGSLGFIDKGTLDTAKNEPLNIRSGDTKIAPYLRETMRVFLEETLGKEKLYTGGLVIQTTINSKAQQEAEKIFQEHCATLRATLMPDSNGALISIDAKTGHIKALVGGYDFNNSKFNRAMQARRQVGSIFKPLIYAVALQAGLRFSDTEIDEPFELLQPNGSIWAPNNYTEKFEGTMTLAYGLSHSNNIVAIKTLLKVGAERVNNLARACNIRGPFHTYPSLALGCIDATLIELAGMFNVFATGGIYAEPHYIKWVKDQWGTKIYKTVPRIERVLPSTVAGKVAKVLELALKRVQQTSEQPWLESEGISKTGTTNDSRTCWYVGSTPSLTTAVYIGCDDNRSMGHNVYPFRTAFPIWLAFNRAMPSKQKKFAYDPSLKEVFINEKTGAPEYRDAPGAISIFA